MSVSLPVTFSVTGTRSEYMRVALPLFLEECERDGVTPDLTDPFAVTALADALGLWAETDISAAQAWEKARRRRDAWREVSSG